MIYFELMDNVENGEEGNGHEMKVSLTFNICVYIAHAQCRHNVHVYTLYVLLHGDVYIHPKHMHVMLCL